MTDSGYAALDLLGSVRHRLSVVTRLRLDARLFDPAPPRTPGTIGRPRVVGQRQPTLARRLVDPHTSWQVITVAGWYRGEARQVEIAATGTAVWQHPGLPRVPLRWVLVRDPADEFRPQASLCTDLDAAPADILAWFVRRWASEVTFGEARRHLGVETQRLWSDLAIARTTPVLLGLYSLVALWAHDLRRSRTLLPLTAAWYAKEHVTFSDALASVRRALWTEAALRTSRPQRDLVEVPRPVLDRLTALARYAA